ncbi:MAG: DsbE family thiol:disulfide interchange protein [Magnetovibrio sp.]|nr:DsbE family thiol:disulfide interchange protein [Magnetovibrio sp.]
MPDRLIYYIPLALFCVLSIYLGIGLTLDPKALPSMLDGKPVPAFKLPPVKNRDNRGFSNTDLIGTVSLVNIFGSWCAACRIEHPFLMELATEKKIIIHGIDWREENPNAGGNWLKRYGDPYSLVGDDPYSKAAIAFGVTGAPETFLVDKKGIVRYKHTGPLNRKIWTNLLSPMIEKLQIRKGS